MKKWKILLLTVVILLLSCVVLLELKLLAMRRSGNEFVDQLECGTIWDNNSNNSPEDGNDLISEITKRSTYSYKMDFVHNTITISVQAPDMQSVIAGIDLDSEGSVADLIQAGLERADNYCENTITLPLTRKGGKYEVDSSSLYSAEAVDALTGNLFSAYVDAYERYMKLLEE